MRAWNGCRTPKTGFRSTIWMIATMVVACAGWAQAPRQLLSSHIPAVVAKGKVTSVGALGAKEHLHLAFELPLRNQDELKAFLTRLYDPSSSDFHKYLTVDEFTARYGPSKEDYQAVVNFVTASGMTIISTPGNRMLVEADGTTAPVNAALHVTMTTYRNPTEARTFFAPDREPTVNLAVSLRHISGLNNLTPPKARLTLNTKPRADDASVYPPTPTGSGPFGSYIPPDFRAAYYGAGPLNGSGQSIGLVEFDGYDQVDLTNFYTNTGWTPTVPVNVVLLGQLTAPLGDGGNDAEPILDMVYALSMTPNLDQLRIYQCCSATYSGSESGPVVILNSIASENIVKQVSSSYGWGPERAAEDPIYEEMAAQGQTFFAATGDYGSPLNPGNDSFDDFYPSDDAWVTAVSMSLLTTNGPGGSWADDIYAGGAGGGYSDGPDPTPLPAYQAGIATAANQASALYRNVPDVVIDGFGSYLCGGSDSTSTHQCFPNAGCTTCTNGGSSMSSPIWASMMALVNEQASVNGKPSIGFLNPALYSIAEGSNYNNDFHDIIGGSTSCCGQSYAYTAVPGYDLVSGWGTPNGPNLINDLVNQTAAFSLLALESNLTMGPNDSASTTISVGASSGFSSPVQLSVSGLPSGVTASFSNNPTSGSALLTLTSNGTPAAGSFVLTIAGTSGSLTAAATVSLTVTSTQGNFTVGSTVTAVALQAGTTNTANANNPNVVTVTSLDNFAGTVTLSMNNLPAGVTASFSPATLTPGANGSETSVLTLVANPTTATGSFTASVVGTSGSLTSSVPFLLATAPSYTVGTRASTFTVAQGASTPVQVYVTSQNDFSSPVTLTIAGLPAGVQASFSPVTVTPPANGNVSSTLTLTASASAVVNSAATSITGTAGGEYATEAVTVSVIAPPPAFSIVSPSAYALNVGQAGYLSVPIDVVASSTTYNLPVSLTISGLPPGLTAQFSPAVVNPGDSAGTGISTLTVTADSTAALGNFTQATISGTDGTVTGTLSIFAGASGSLTAADSVVPTGGNQTLNYTVAQVLLNGSNWIGVFPHGSSPQVPNPLAQATAGSLSGTVSLNVTNLPAGNYDAWLFYSGGTTTVAGPATFVVGAAPSFSVTAAPVFVNLSGGAQQVVALTVSSLNGFSDPVTLSVSGLPSGVSATFASPTVTPTAGGSVAAVLTLTPAGTSQAAESRTSGFALALLGAPLAMLIMRRRRKLKLLGLLVLLLSVSSLLAGLTSCSSNPPTTTPTTSAVVTVTGTSGAQTASASFTLYVK